MAATDRLEDEHVLVRHDFPARYGDRPAPWEIVFECTCGAEIFSAEEGRGDTCGTPDDNFQDHLSAVDSEKDDDVSSTESEESHV